MDGVSRPDNVLQFRTPKMSAEEHKRIRQYYRGSCGPDQDFWPKRHRWGPWKPCYGGRGEERMCLTCALMSDIRWKPEGRAAQVGTHPKGGDAKLAPGDSLSDAVPPTAGCAQTPEFPA